MLATPRQRNVALLPRADPISFVGTWTPIRTLPRYLYEA